MRTPLILLVLLAALAVSCGNYERTPDSMTSGALRVGIDESYSLMMASQIEVFNTTYPEAMVEGSFAPEGEIIARLLADSIEAAVISRPLSEEEVNFFRTRGKIPQSVKIAEDGIALIVHPENPDTVLTLQQAEQIFGGSLADWSAVSGQPARQVQVVFDHNKSCNARYISERFLGGGPFPANCFAVNSNQEVIDYVASHPEALGIISVSWISDREDSTSQEFLRKVRVVGIRDSSNADRPEMARKPYQAYIFDKSYPLRREVYAIRTGLQRSVGTGFVSFLSGEKGQLIIHKMGMVASHSPVRVIRITE